MSVISRIRAALRTNNYEYSQHALEEMDEDDLSSVCSLKVSDHE